MRIGSLFSGYGGLDMAVQAVLGGTVAWYSEIEPAACRVLEAHLPGVPNLGDVTKVDWSQVEPVDVLTGGYPCQPFSHAGKRKGTNDERHLWPYVRDALAALRPMVAVFENVDGHRSLGLSDVLGDLAGLGLSARWGVVRAADAGAPHGRKRVFIVTYPSRQPGREGPRCDSAQSGVSGPDRGGHRDAANSISQRHDGSRIRRSEASTDRGWTDVARPAASPADADSERHGGRQGPRVVEGVGSATEVSRWQASTAWQEPRAGGDSVTEHSNSEHVGALKELSPHSQGRNSSGTCPPTDWGKYAAAISRWERTISRPAPAPTILGTNGRPRLSPVFVEWMMGLPEGHVTGHGLSNSQALKMLGNGVVPQQAALALHLLGVAA